jgi:hypothetical protein
VLLREVSRANLATQSSHASNYGVTRPFCSQKGVGAQVIFRSGPMAANCQMRRNPRSCPTVRVRHPGYCPLGAATVLA